ncbi:MAG: glycosyltransferase family 9 protein [Bacteroidia bacterium]|nr:glycosyltransferase family 9 protein [Bacteroidia bacterium]MDW8134478.1 glycosyltransferase family 9 protein [Bacteroidia bacterium]
MGDVILTTPLIRALVRKFPEAEVHFLTRSSYEPLLAYHPLLKAVHSWPPSRSLRKILWTGIIDLQKNLRTLALRWQFRYKYFTTFPKENYKKWKMVNFHHIVPLQHVVLRYGEALRSWGIKPEELERLEVHIPSSVEQQIRAELREKAVDKPWLAVGLGGTYATKRWPLEYYEEFLNSWGWPTILLGGVAEKELAAYLAGKLRFPVIVGAGRYSLLETAAAIKEASLLLSHDTGTAHLGAAMGTPTAVIWGNTIPQFGMTPWYVPHVNIEVSSLPCRPCSKLGFDRCPKGHHKCMRLLTPDYVARILKDFWVKQGMQA